MAVINGSYEECEKWMGKFSLKHSIATFHAKLGSCKRSATRKKKKKNKVLEDSKKSRILRGRRRGNLRLIKIVGKELL